MATFTNQALLSYNGVTTPSNTVTGELVGALTVTKTALSGEYSPGGTVTYIVSLVNSGTVALTGLTVSDDLGAYTSGGETYVPLTYTGKEASLTVNGVPQNAPAETINSGVEFSGIDVPALGSAVLVYRAHVNGFAPLESGGSITNTAEVTGAQIANPVSDSAVVTPVSEPILSITKSMDPVTVMENGSLTYTFVIENSGSAPTAEEAGLVVSDTFVPVLSNITVTLDGAALVSPGDYTYNEITGAFATTAGTISVPAATYSRNPDGSLGVIPGCAELIVTGTV